MAEVALAVAGWFVAPIIGKAAIELLGDLLERRTDLKKELEELRRNLLLLQPALEEAEKKECSKFVIQQYKQILYDILDLLELHKANMDLKQHGRRGFHIKRKRIKGFTSNLEDILSQVRKLKPSEGDVMMDPVAKLAKARETTSSLTDKSTVVGRDEDREVIINLLLPAAGAGASKKKSFGVIPIVGMGGVGKTTLARLVFNDTEVKEAFDLKIWVFVGLSAKLNRQKILKDVLNTILSRENRINEIPPSDSNLEVLENSVQKEFTKKNSKPFLLVLDDAWDSDSETWRAMLEPFKACAAEGSRVIVTTRDKEFADSIADDNKIQTISLGLLGDEDMWNIFKRNAFNHDEPFSRDAGMGQIGWEIVKKLKGLPLSAIKISDLLRKRREKKYWEIILNKLLKIKEVENAILPILKLSYYCLSPNLKLRFSYLSLFPKGSQFGIDGPYSKHDIARQWMAHESFSLEDRTQLEYAATGCGFGELINRSLLQMADMDTLEDDCFAMHDSVHDLAENISEGEIVRVSDDDTSEQLPTRIRHIFFPRENPRLTFKKLGNHKTLRSLLHCSPAETSIRNLPDSLFESLRYLRVLCLHNARISTLPKSIGNLPLLHLLDLRLPQLRNLPETLPGLLNLQRLKLQGCKCLTVLPTASIAKLVKLIELEVYNCPEVVLKPTNPTDCIRWSLVQLSISESPKLFPSLFGSGLILPSLKQVSIASDGSLNDWVLSACLSALTALQKLTISNCSSITSIEETLDNLRATRGLEIQLCQE